VRGRSCVFGKPCIESLQTNRTHQQEKELGDALSSLKSFSASLKTVLSSMVSLPCES
jgi:hypothetical protein